jgi:hypothetical protein
MDHDINSDKRTENDENYKGADPELRELSFPDSDNILYSILNSLNYNIANFYTYTKFKNYISESSLDLELLQKSMSIHRDFSALVLHTKEEMVLMYPDLLEKAEKLLFKGEIDTDLIKYTSKMCRVINEYKISLYREGYLPELKMQLLMANI